MSFGRARAVVRRNIALVGDASCTFDGIAGQGLSLAFQQAIHLATAFATEDLAGYESAHARITQTAVRMTRLLLLMDRSVWFRHKVLRLFASKPGLFSKMIAIHTGSFTRDSFGAKDVFHLGWRVLWA
jgi:menaquinone-9 beta-reductase